MLASEVMKFDCREPRCVREDAAYKRMLPSRTACKGCSQAHAAVGFNVDELKTFIDHGLRPTDRSELFWRRQGPCHIALLPRLSSLRMQMPIHGKCKDEFRLFCRSCADQAAPTHTWCWVMAASSVDQQYSRAR